VNSCYTERWRRPIPRWENYRKHDSASHLCQKCARPASYRVADVGVDVVLNVFQHFVEVAGTCRTQKASVTITLSTHTQPQTDRRIQLLGIISSSSSSSRLARQSQSGSHVILPPGNTNIKTTPLRQCVMPRRQELDNNCD